MNKAYGENLTSVCRGKSRNKFVEKESSGIKKLAKSKFDIKYSCIHLKICRIYAIQYLRTYREVEIQQSILEIVMPMYEQAKVEEQKSMPTIMLMDKAIAPQLKYSPKRSVIIFGTFISCFIHICAICFLGRKSR